MSISSQERVTLLTDYDAQSPYRVAYRSLYANICLNWDDASTRPHAVLLTTPVPYPGQATAAANIAIAAAQSGWYTVLVDADLHTATLFRSFGLEVHQGLSELLQDEELLTGPVIAPYLHTTFVPNLQLLSAGQEPSQAGTHLLTTGFPQALHAVQQHIAASVKQPAVIIVHGPAVLSGIDASVLSTAVDQTLLTLVAGKTTRKQARQARDQLERAHTKHVGLILLEI